MSIWSNIAAFWKKDTAEQQANNATMVHGRKPFDKDITEDIKVNGELTRGLASNSYPGFKVSGALAYAPINVPVSFMGAPIPMPVNEDQRSEDALKKLIDEHLGQCYEIERSSHRDGTIWVWPYYSSKKNKLYWEIILDDSVTDIIKDVDTGEPIEIVTNENITYRLNENVSTTANRVRRFTRDTITDTYSQRIPGSAQDTQNQLNQRRGRNRLGLLPIPFSNMPDVGNIRGNSDLQRIIPNLKLHNDILQQWSTQLAKFKPKLIQSTTDVDGWAWNNGVNLSTFNPQQMDFVVNDSGKEEKTEYAFLEGMGDEYTKALNVHYWLAVQGSAIPEIIWGLVSTGNQASPEAQMTALMQYVYNKQIQATKPFELLFTASLQLIAMAEMFTASDVKVSWNKLDTLSPVAKSEVISKFATGVEKLVNSGVPTETIHKFFVDFYPDATDNDIDVFKKQVGDASARLAFMKSTYQEQLEAGGNDSLDELIERNR